MLFNSGSFVFLFLPIALAVYATAMHVRWFKSALAWLALASLFFYGYWSPLSLPLLLGSVLFNFTAGKAVDPSRSRLDAGGRKLTLALAVGGNLALLFFFKYADFFAHSVDQLLGIPVPLLGVALPIGISFYTFTQIAYLVDSYHGKATERSFVAYLLFVTYFPHLIAGPILHHREMMPQFLGASKRAPSLDKFLVGCAFFVIGLAKKVLIADNVAPLANRVFTMAEHDTLGLATSWLGAIAYTVQIYFDFSGYSDMAVGLSLMFGIALPFNFASPYKSTSIVEFWRTWHMTLSRFLRDYLYIPLGGNRHGPARRQLNLMLTMLLGGLWHGAAWTFVVWGLLHGLFLQVNHAWRHFAQRSRLAAALIARFPLAWSALAWSLTMLAVVVAWVFFRAESFTAAINVLHGMFAGAASLQVAVLDAHTAVYLAIGLAIALTCRNSQQLCDAFAARLQRARATPAVDAVRGALVGGSVCTVVALAVISASHGVNEFIYFNF